MTELPGLDDALTDTPIDTHDLESRPPWTLDRRELLRGAGALVMAWHAPLLARAAPAVDPRPSLAGPPRARLRRLKLACAEVEATRSFYGDLFGWPVAKRDGGFDLQAGASTLELRPAAPGEAPFYHFAFNISRNKFDQAHAWLAERTQVVRADDGRTRFHFSSRDADAVYWVDPAGNLGELIAHSRLDNERPGAFGLGDIHDCCEIGLVSPRVAGTVAWLGQHLDAQPYREPTDDFAAVGDERGFFIVVREGRAWFPRRLRAAAAAPAAVVIDGTTRRRLDVPETLATIQVEPA